MLFSKNWLTSGLLASFCLVIFDQVIKQVILNNPSFTFYLWEPWLGLELFQNPGVAFGLPLPNWLLVLGTPILLVFLGLHLHKKSQHPKTSVSELLGYILIIGGALSNYIDRVIYAITIDYLRILYSVINLADIMIVFGLIKIFLSSSKIDKNV